MNINMSTTAMAMHLSDKAQCVIAEGQVTKFRTGSKLAQEDFNKEFKTLCNRYGLNGGNAIIGLRTMHLRRQSVLDFN